MRQGGFDAHSGLLIYEGLMCMHFDRSATWSMQANSGWIATVSVSVSVSVCVCVPELVQQRHHHLQSRILDIEPSFA